MKLKLVAIGMIALLVLTVAPMAVAAKPSQSYLPQAIRYPIILKDTSDVVGWITVDMSAGHYGYYTFTARGLWPYTEYQLSIYWFIYKVDLAVYQANGRGLVRGDGTIPEDWTSILQRMGKEVPPYEAAFVLEWGQFP